MITRRALIASSLAFAPLLPAQSNPFVPAGFQVPELYLDKRGIYKLRPLGPKLAKQDFDAYMSSIEHLQKTFSYSTRWPHAGLTMADAMKDVEGEMASFEARKKFTYAVVNMNENKEYGCVYISPSAKEGYDAVVRMWVTAAQAEIDFDKRLYDDMRIWIKSRWPFEKVAFVGKEISRDDFQKLPNKPKV